MRAAVIKESILPDSLPKHSASTHPRRVRSETPADANIGAAAVAKGTGSSRTRSAPPSNAILVRVYLSIIAGAPRCTKFPLIATTAKSAFAAFLASSIW